MPTFPAQSKDAFDLALPFMGKYPQDNTNAGFNAPNLSSASGVGSRQAIQSERPGYFRRKLVHWMVPDGPMVQMYVNPTRIVTNNKKEITRNRTKGGYSIQYWGEALTELQISGTTGTSGIEGINVLSDIYRNEQIVFDTYGLYQASKMYQETFAGDVFGQSWLGGSGGSSIASTAEDIGNIFDGGDISSGDAVMSMFGIVEQAAVQAARKPPSLASLAATVEMYWSGEVYRGFFDSFNVTEQAEKLGLFDYEIRFIATQKRGIRRNFLAWHRSATDGPSDSDPVFGRPHSYGALVNVGPSTPPSSAL